MQKCILNKVDMNKFINQKIRRTILIVLDGWGHREDMKDNAIATAKTPNFNKYWNIYPTAS